MSPIRTAPVHSRKPGRSRRKGKRSAKALRQAIARRKLEQYREEQLLKDHLYDVFDDE